MTGNAVTTSIITNGLTCNPAGTACKNGIITTFFSLYCVDAPIPPEPKPQPPPVSGGGGAYPRDAWNKFNPGDIQKFFKPLNPEQQHYIIPRDQEARYFQRRKIIKLEINFGEKRIEKEYSVPEKRARVTVKVLDIANATLQSMTATVNNIKRITSNAVVYVKNIRLKK